MLGYVIERYEGSTHYSFYIFQSMQTVNRYVLTKDFSTSCDKNEEREKQEILGFYSPLKLYPNLFYNTVN